MRVTNSGTPRFHIFFDMDFSPAKDAQTISTLFADQRSMRPDVPGTVARGELEADMNFMTGIDMEALSRMDSPRAERLVRNLLNPDDGDDQGDTNNEDAKPKKKDRKNESGRKQEEVNKDVANKEKDSATKENAKRDDSKKNAGKSEKVDAAEQDAKAKPEPSKPVEKSDKKPVKNGKKSDKENAPKKSAAGKMPQDESRDEKAAKPDHSEADHSEADQASHDEKSPASEPAGATEEVKDTTPWLTENPLPVDEKLLRQGQLQFKIYCSVCHGLNGGGNGLVNRRARKILASSWIPPSSLHQDTLTREKYPDGKLFSTITNGIRKMPGYGSQIKSADRWAIVAYVRALQSSQNASIDLVPADQRNEIEKMKQEIDEQLRLQAEAERLQEEERAKQAAEKKT